MPLHFTSSAFTSEEQRVAGATGSSAIPAKYANAGVPGGHNVSIPYAWTPPADARGSFALTIVDTAPVAHGWVHWIVADIPTSVTSLAEGASGTAAMPSGAIELSSSYGTPGYGGPRPPAGTGAHHYVATLYLLDLTNLGLPRTARLEDFKRAIEGHVIAQDTCTGTFER